MQVEVLKELVCGSTADTYLYSVILWMIVVTSMHIF